MYVGSWRLYAKNGPHHHIPSPTKASRNNKLVSRPTVLLAKF